MSALARWLPSIGLAAALLGALSACGRPGALGAGAPAEDQRGVRPSEEAAQTALFALG